MKGFAARVAAFFMAFAAGSLFLCGALAPAQAASSEKAPSVPAGAYILIEAQSGQVLAGKGEHESKYPASITKILTLALTIELLSSDYEKKLGEKITASERACSELIPGATSISLTADEELSLNDLMHATQIVSANDAANVLAEYADASIEGFTERMNRQMKTLGLEDSHFTNPSGQPDEEHHTSAYDMAQITRWALGVEGFRELFSSTQYTMGPTNKRNYNYDFQVSNSIILPENRYYYPGITGSKMGYTDAAQYTLVTSAERDGVELICVVLDCATNDAKYDATTKLLDYGFENFTQVTYPATGLASKTVPVYGGGDEALGEIKLTGNEDASFVLHNSLSIEDLSVRYNIPGQYVIGQDFEPTAEVYIAVEDPVQPAELATLTMTWTGLDEILRKNTSPLVIMAQENPFAFWVIAGGIAASIFLIVGHIIFKRHSHNKRRAARLAAARAKVPIRIADRPPQGAPTVSAANRKRKVAFPAENERRPARADWGVCDRAVLEPSHRHVEPPRRVGRAR